MNVHEANGINDRSCTLYDWTTGPTGIGGTQETAFWWDPKFFGYLAFVLTFLFSCVWSFSISVCSELFSLICAARIFRDWRDGSHRRHEEAQVLLMKLALVKRKDLMTWRQMNTANTQRSKVLLKDPNNRRYIRPINYPRFEACWLIPIYMLPIHS